MNKARTISISAVILLAVLGTGWALEKGYSTQRGVASDEPTAESNPVNAPGSTQPMDEQPAASGARHSSTATPRRSRADIGLS